MIHFGCNFSPSFRSRPENNHSYPARGKVVCNFSDPPCLTCFCHINIISFHLETINTRHNNKVFANDVFNHIGCSMFYVRCGYVGIFIRTNEPSSVSFNQEKCQGKTKLSLQKLLGRREICSESCDILCFSQHPLSSCPQVWLLIWEKIYFAREKQPEKYYPGKYSYLRYDIDKSDVQCVTLYWCLSVAESSHPLEPQS